MEIKELTPHAEELKKMLEGKVEEEQLLAELNTYLNVYHVSMEAAKRGILRKYGGEIGFIAVSTTKKISELTGNEQSVDVTGRAVFVERKDINVRGTPKTIISGIFGDETGTAPFTIWDVKDTFMEKGSTYILKNVYTKLWNEKVQINLGNRGIVEKIDAEIIVPEKTIAYTSSEVKIGELHEGMGNVTVTGKILSTETRTIQSQGEPKVVYSGMIADSTGKVQFSAWKDFELKENESVRIDNAYIRSWKGIPQLNIGERGEVARVDDIGNVITTEYNDRTIADLVKVGGGLDISVSGTVIDLRVGSGLINRCPECNRSLLGEECITHGKVVPINDLRMKLTVDDGTGAISAVINREDTERLTGVTLDLALGVAEKSGPEEVIKLIGERILIKDITIAGNVMSDEYGPSMIVRSVSIRETDIEAEAEELLNLVEGAI